MALPAFIGGWVASKIADAAGAIATRVMIALGIAFTTYNFAAPAFTAWFQSYFGAMPADMRSALALLKIDIAITMIISAVGAKLIARTFLTRRT